MKAFCPANLSCIFSAYRSDSAQKSGSLGIGITIDKGAHVHVAPSEKNIIIVNEKQTSFPTVEYVLAKLDTTATVTITTDVPFGCGFGMSGASALATAYALNNAFSLGKALEELALIAHCAEVENGTGLGDIAGQFHGGVLIKKEKNDPFSVQKLPLTESSIHYKIYGPIDTKSVISGSLETINLVGEQILEKVDALTTIDLAQLLSLSYEFSKQSKLLKPQVEKDIKQIISKGGAASMIMLGESVMSTIAFEGSISAQIIHQGAHHE